MMPLFLSSMSHGAYEHHPVNFSLNDNGPIWSNSIMVYPIGEMKL